MILLALLGLLFISLLLMVAGAVIAAFAVYKVYEYEDAVLVEIGTDLSEVKIYKEKDFTYKKKIDFN